MGWRPDPHDKGEWSTAGGVLMAAGAAGAIGWLAIAEPSSSHEPLWPVYAFSLVAVGGLYGMLAPLLRWWPWNPGTAKTRTQEPSEATQNTNMNRILRKLFHEHQGRRSISQEEHLMLTTEPPPITQDQPASVTKAPAATPVRIEHRPIRWDQIGERPEAGEEEIPLEPWLEDRIAAHAD